MKNISRFLVCFITFILFLSTSVLANNDLDLKDKGEEVFDEETLKEINEAAEKKPVMEDKAVRSNEKMGKLAKSRLSVYPTRKGVILVTKDKYKGLIPTGHAAIIYTKGTVIESLSKGVSKGKNNWNKSKNTCYGVTVNDTKQKQDEAVADWCAGKIGKPYNYNFLDVNTRKKFYCSQLVWAAYKDKYKINLNTSDFGKAVHPMELVSSSKTYKIYEK